MVLATAYRVIRTLVGDVPNKLVGVPDKLVNVQLPNHPAASSADTHQIHVGVSKPGGDAHAAIPPKPAASRPAAHELSIVLKPRGDNGLHGQQVKGYASDRYLTALHQVRDGNPDKARTRAKANAAA